MAELPSWIRKIPRGNRKFRYELTLGRGDWMTVRAAAQITGLTRETLLQRIRCIPALDDTPTRDWLFRRQRRMVCRKKPARHAAGPRVQTHLLGKPSATPPASGWLVERACWRDL